MVAWRERRFREEVYDRNMALERARRLREASASPPSETADSPHDPASPDVDASPSRPCEPGEPT